MRSKVWDFIENPGFKKKKKNDFCINISNHAGNMIYTKFAVYTAWIKANKKLKINAKKIMFIFQLNFQSNYLFRKHVFSYKMQMEDSGLHWIYILEFDSNMKL